jgi:hypothetical protein
MRTIFSPEGSASAASPDAGAHAVYDGYYRIYRELYSRNAGTMHALDALARGSTAPT